MTKIGCNYSIELMELLNDEIIDVDYIKVTLDDFFKEHIDIAKELKPLMVHYLGYQERATMKDFKSIDFDYINSKLQELASPVTGIHTYIDKEDFESKDPSYGEALERTLEVLSHFKNSLNVPILIENYPYSEYYDSLDNHYLTADPRLFHDICESLDLGVILDIAHAKCYSSHEGISLKEYLIKFPLNRIVELHVNSTFEHEEHGVIDKHLELTEEDYEIIEWLIERCEIQYLTLEYGGIGKVQLDGRSNKESIERQLVRLTNILNY